MKAIIMAGGDGNRLRPLTCECPKPMVPVVNKPVMQHIVELLSEQGFNEIAVTLKYMPKVVKDYFKDGKKFGIDIKYYVEDKPLGTAGSVKNTGSFIDETFVVISGDALTDIDLKSALQFHFSKGADATVIIKKVAYPLEYGVVVTDKEGRIRQFIEKPRWCDVISDTVNTGIYILSPEVMDYCPENEMADFSKDIFPKLLQDNKKIYGYLTDAYWCDIGDIRAYLRANIDVLNGEVNVKINGNKINNNVWIDSDCIIDNTAIINGPCVIGKNTRINSGVEIGSYSVIGDDNIINSYAGIKRSIIWNKCYIGKNAQLRGSIISNKVRIENSVSIYEYSVLAEDTIVHSDVVIKPNVKIWPGKTIGNGLCIRENIVWDTAIDGKRLFGNSSVIKGDANLVLSPEFSAKLGAVYGNAFNNNARIGIACDEGKYSKILYLAFISGLMSSGIEIYDFENILFTMAKDAVLEYKLDGFVYIFVSDNQKEKVGFYFLDRFGYPIDNEMQRKIENIFSKADYVRSDADSIKEIVMVNDYASFYTSKLYENIENRFFGFRILIILRSEFTKTVGEKIFYELLKHIGCESCVHYLEEKNDLDEDSYKEIIKIKNQGNYEIAAVFDEMYEKMILFDEYDYFINEHVVLAVSAYIHLSKNPGSVMFVPPYASKVIDMITERNGGKIVRYRDNNDLENFKDLSSNYFYKDAISELLKIIEFIFNKKITLSELVKDIPKINIETGNVKCDWESKGKVLSEIINKNMEKYEVTGGIKLHDDKGWVLIFPDAENPVFNIVSEGNTEEFAKELTDIYSEEIRRIIEN